MAPLRPHINEGSNSEAAPPREERTGVRPLPERFPRPEIKMNISSEEWEEFLVSWEQYKEEYSLAGAGLIRQLVASCPEEVRRSLSRLTANRHFTLTEEELLRQMRELVVTRQDPAESVQQLLGLSLDQGESLPHYLSRLRALASQSDLSVPCPSCSHNVSFSDFLVRHKLAASLGQKEILTTTNLDQSVLELETGNTTRSELRIVSIESLYKETPTEHQSRQTMKECATISENMALQSVECLRASETSKRESIEDDENDDDDDDDDEEEEEEEEGAEERAWKQKIRKYVPKLRIFRSTKTGKCPFCGFKNKKRRALYRHYSQSHYRSELLSLIQEDGTCPLCEFQSDNLRSLISHIGSDHDKVEMFLPEEFHVPKENLQVEIIIDDDNSEESAVLNNETEEEDDDESCESLEPVFNLECHLCGSKHKQRSQLYGHYAGLHYREDLEDLVDKSLISSLQCPLCEKEFVNTNGLVKHIGVLHNFVEKFLPAEHHVPRSKRGRKEVPEVSYPNVEFPLDNCSKEDIILIEDDQETEFQFTKENIIALQLMTMKKDGAGEAEEGEIKETEEEELEPTVREDPCDDDMKPSGSEDCAQTEGPSGKPRNIRDIFDSSSEESE